MFIVESTHVHLINYWETLGGQLVQCRSQRSLKAVIMFYRATTPSRSLLLDPRCTVSLMKDQ